MKKKDWHIEVVCSLDPDHNLESKTEGNWKLSPIKCPICGSDTKPKIIS